MEGMRGLLHKTSIEQAQEQHNEQGSHRLHAGQKRSWSTADKDSGRKVANTLGTVQFQRSISLPSRPSSLQPSKIVDLALPGDGPSEYTQRRVLAVTPTASRDPELDLAHQIYGLPPQIVNNFASLGIKQIYPWQKNCLKGPGLLTGVKNLVYCAPTGGGKSLVADSERNMSFK
jgi:ATP-dependent helicase YprA (DUF1998 family)